MDQSFHAQVVEMTPEWAAELLKSNTNNRGLSKTKVKSFVKQIDNGKWRKTGQAISIATSGRLLDGQTRLNAIMQSGKPVTMLVAWNCDEDSFPVFDTGRARSATDVLKIAGCDKHQSMISAGLRLAIPLIEKPEEWFTISQGITNEEILSLWDETKDECSWCANESSYLHSEFTTISASIYFTFLYLAVRKGWDKDSLTQFSLSLATGNDLELGSPVLAYRKFVVNNAQKVNMNHQRLTTLACLIHCFNLHATASSVNKFKMPNLPPMIQIVDPS